MHPAVEARQVVGDRDRRERPRDHDAALAVRELLARQRGVRRAEVDGPCGDARDAGTRPGRRVGDVDAVGPGDLRDPLRDEREGERRSRPDQLRVLLGARRGVRLTGDGREHQRAHEGERRESCSLHRPSTSPLVSSHVVTAATVPASPRRVGHAVVSEW